MDICMKNLLESLSENDTQKAKQYAKIMLENNNKKCDEDIKKKLLPKLSTTLITLPANIQRLVEVDDVGKYFEDNRYVIRTEEEEVVKTIISIWNARDELTKYKFKYLNSLLLHGKPGCGKTMLAKYIAYKLNLPFLYINFNTLISSYLGKTGENLQTIFEYVKENRCVLMLDELDIIGLERGKKQDVGEMNRIVINLMQCLDKLDINCIIIAATNRKDMIDKALERRFSVDYKMYPPSIEVKKKIIQSYLETIPNNCTDSDLLEFAKKFESCSDLTNALIQRIVKCITNKEKITLK